MSVMLADRSFQHPIGIAKNMLVEVGKFTFPVDFVILEMEEDSKVPLILGRPFLHTADAVIRVKQKQLNLGVEADFDALLDEGSEILHSIKRTILEEKLFVEFDEFMAMNIEGNSDSEFETEEPPFENITFNTDYKIKTSLKGPPSDLELKPLPNHLEYVFLKEPSFLPIIISSQLSEQNKNKLISVLKRHKQAFAWKTTDIPGICPCILAIFHDMIEESVEVFMDDFFVFGNSFDNCLDNLDKMLQRCKDANLVLNWDKCHFMVKEGIVLGHKVSGAGLEVDKAKIDVISKHSPPTNVKGTRSFLGHAGFYRRFIKDFSKITYPLTKFLKKDTPFEFNDECHKAFNSLKEKLTCTLVIVSLNWNLPFDLMCNASEFAVGAVLGQKDEFDIEIKDKKGTKNVTADHLSRIDNDETSDDSDVDDNFLGETLMEITTKDTPWFADFANYLEGDIILKGMMYQQRNKFFSDLKNYFWEDPFLFKVCLDGMIRRCISGPETRTILDQCHHGPTSGHYGPNTTAKKVLDSGFYWPTIIKEAHTLVRLCEAC
ncbi:reverse transcriptase domain-containing protein [Tanacetum coccineum]